MPGLVPGIHAGPRSGALLFTIPAAASPYDVDGRDKPGHDGQRELL